MKKVISLILITVILSLLLVSCGSDRSEYLAEEIMTSVEKGSETWEKIENMLDLLSVDSAHIPEFDSAGEALKLFKDSTLNYMCCKSYRKYAGNADVLDEIDMGNISGSPIAAIPAAEFEAVMYTYYGGSVKVNHGDTKLFTYNKESSVYVPVTSPIAGGVDRNILSVDETENTYRVSFECTAGEYTASYFALLIKREDGSCYFSLLMHR